jgi:hypothetical protein
MGCSASKKKFFYGHHIYIMKFVSILDNILFVVNICSADISSKEFADISEIDVWLRQCAVKDFLVAGGEKPTWIHGHLLMKIFSVKELKLLQT